MLRPILDRQFVLLMVGFVIVSGCGGGAKEQPFTDDSRDSAVYGSRVKSQAVHLLNQAKQSPAEAANTALLLQELVEDFEKQPAGEHVAKDKGLRTGAQELKSLADKSAPETTKKIEEFIALAQTLPGDLKPVGEGAVAPNPGDIDR